MMHVLMLCSLGSSFMGEEALRCLDCQGKFGRAVLDLRCSTCAVVFRLRDLLLSESFPGIGAQFAEPIIREAYHRVLEIADNYRRFQAPAASEAAVSEAKKAGPVEEEAQPGSFPKSKPAEKSESAPASLPSSPAIPPVEKKKKSKKDKTKRKSRSPKSPLVRPRDRSRRVDSESSPAAKEEPVSEEAEIGEETRGKEKKTRERESSPRPARDSGRARSPPRRRSRQRSRSARRSPLRPRSPPGPPPPREDPAARWTGPIPSHRHRGYPPAPPPRHPEASNKGAKKRRQQQLFNEFKAWRKRYNRY